MKKVCLIALLPWVLSCGWASSLFSSAPAEGEEPQVTVVAAEESAPAAASLPAEGEVVATAAVVENAAVEAPVTAAASSDTVQTPASSASTPPAGGAATVAGNGAAVPAATSNAATAATSSAAVPASPVPMTAPGPVTAISPAPGSVSAASAPSGSAVGGVYSVSPVSYGVGAMADDSRSRVERRRMKVEEFAHRMDSLVTSRNFLFLPSSMQEFPGGGLQMIYNVYFYFAICGDRVEVHLPTTRGAFLPYVEILNFDTSELTDYRCSPAQSGWNISFGLANGETRYNVNIYVTTTTGETILTLYMNSATIRYVGYIKAGTPAA